MSNAATITGSGLIRKREPWLAFGIKAAALLTILIMAGMAFADRYAIVADPQLVKCIPGTTLYLVDKYDTQPVRDGLFMFYSKDLDPIYEKGTKMLKYMRGVPGDRIEIRDNDQVFINNVASEWGLELAEEKLGRKASDFHGAMTLGSDQFWFMGTSVKSFDSRYWGAVNRNDIVGRAYAIF